MEDIAIEMYWITHTHNPSAHSRDIKRHCVYLSSIGLIGNWANVFRVSHKMFHILLNRVYESLSVMFVKLSVFLSLLETELCVSK